MKRSVPSPSFLLPKKERISHLRRLGKDVDHKMSIAPHLVEVYTQRRSYRKLDNHQAMKTDGSALILQLVSK